MTDPDIHKSVSLIEDLKDKIENKTIEILKDNSKAEEFLIETGIYTEDGELSGEYRPRKITEQ